MPYLLHDDSVPYNQWHQQRVLTHASASATAELFALIAMIDVESAQTLLMRLAGGRNPLDALRQTNSHELQKLSLTPKRAGRVIAAIELGRRLYAASISPQVIDSPAAAAAVLSYDLAFQPQEKAAVLVLDVKHHPICTEIISHGTATETLMHPREVFRAVIQAGGIRCIVAHNHPSGVVEPSPDDIARTQQLLHASQALEIPLLDHLILGNGTHCSMRQSTALWDEYQQD